jgi:hypothetical protein
MNRALKSLLYSSLAGSLVVLLAVPFFGAIWHLTHGDFITYHEWKIRVPSDFYARQYLNGAYLWKLTIGYPLQSAPYGMIAVSVLPRSFEYKEDYQNFTTGADLAGQSLGYKFLSTQEVSIGKTLGYCHEYGLPEDPSKSFVQCMVDHTDLFLGYEGHRKFIPILFSTLQSIADQKAEAVQSR